MSHFIYVPFIMPGCANTLCVPNGRRRELRHYPAKRGLPSSLRECVRPRGGGGGPHTASEPVLGKVKVLRSPGNMSARRALTCARMGTIPTPGYRYAISDICCTTCGGMGGGGSLMGGMLPGLLGLFGWRKTNLSKTDCISSSISCLLKISAPTQT